MRPREPPMYAAKPMTLDLHESTKFENMSNCLSRRYVFGGVMRMMGYSVKGLGSVDKLDSLGRPHSTQPMSLNRLVLTFTANASRVQLGEY